MKVRITKEQQRSIEKLHVDFANRLGTLFTETVGKIVDSDIKFVDQTTYAEFIMSLSNPSVSYTFQIAPLGGPAVLDFALPIAYKFVKHELGEKLDGPLQESEREAVNTVLKKVLSEFSEVWASVENIQLSDTMLETNPEYLGVAEPSDTVILIAFEIHFHDASGLISLAYPYATLESVLDKFDA